jgi:hypothetical protein
MPRLQLGIGMLRDDLDLMRAAIACLERVSGARQTTNAPATHRA